MFDVFHESLQSALKFTTEMLHSALVIYLVSSRLAQITIINFSLGNKKQSTNPKSASLRNGVTITFVPRSGELHLLSKMQQNLIIICVYT